MARRSVELVRARARARQRRLEMDADRAARDERIEEAVATFLVHQDRWASMQEQAAEVAALAGAELRLLLGEGLTQEQVGQLCDLEVAQVRRLARAGAGGRAASA